MRRTIATLAAGCLLALAPMLGSAQASGDAGDGLIQVLVDSATTRDQHQALARYFRAEAAEARALAESHAKMSRSYSGKPGELRNMTKHCSEISKLNENLAGQYDALAKAEDAAAAAAK